jgi:uncharacterized protein
MSSVLLISALVLGFGGSLHCVGMCGPLVMGMPFQHVKNRATAMLLYMLAKASAYAALGVVIGLIGKGFALLAMQQALSFTAGVFIIVFALLPRVLHLVKLPSSINKQMGDAYGRVLQNPSLYHFFVFGFFNGLLPCGLVYAALAAASATASPVSGGIFMLLFGVGNAPALIATVLVKSKGSLVFRKSISRFSLVIMLAAGIILMLRSFEQPHHANGEHHNLNSIECLTGN